MEMDGKNLGPLSFVVMLALALGAFAAQIGWALTTGKDGQAPFLLTFAAVVVAYRLLMCIPSLRRLVNSDA
ncbi:MAG: hypothetical protein O9248_00160 [Rhodobacteraceae bacterium]|nr:hypothetical protein [Paracoccaceae bacterium]